MDFALNDEQAQLQDSLARLLSSHYSFEDRRHIAASESGWSNAMWARYAELGLLALPIAAEHGGFDGGASELLPVMEALGRSLTLEPYLSTIVLCARALQLAGSAAQQAQYLPAIAQGQLRMAWARTEWNRADDATAPLQTRARRDGNGGWLLEGDKSMVLHGADAHAWIVSAEVHDHGAVLLGPGLFLVEKGALGTTLSAYKLIDQTPAADLRLRSTPATALGEPGMAQHTIDAVQAAGLAAVCARATGAMQAALDLTADYLKTREQFGRAIGSNQTLQHRAAEMLIATEQARSMALLAAMAVDEPGAPASARNLSLAKIVVGHEGRMVGQQAVQLHGGIGMTEEYAVGHYLRHLTVLNQLFGDVSAHQRRVAAMG
ncbi:acyl-CoA dehydrogenase family protein [Hydrogenophaga sp.]|uniref:acyl-CoA dehydrogenase family protein n=1 Tax=Hydrogenophaga sp. TaxID=1904254 RepID=UPI00271B9963|nr:acyl-CoA dehydrogenase family protein [Hydrogenophaga sp.]MDO9439070.1 acyl-CoA dehydrogenase family protein [Hydrogenophaga sp.]